MKLSFLGGARTVTGSMHLIEVNSQRVLLDCGIFQGRRAESEQRNLNLPFEAHCANALILSHAHIDHSGNIPTLVRGGFVGDILCTPATRDLAAIMLRDSARIQEKDVEYVNKIRARKNEPPIAPLYTVADAEQAIQYLVARAYHRTFDVVPGVRATFFDAGHILGSAITVLDISENGKTTRLAFSGDLGRKRMPLLKSLETIRDVDYLIVESTYGDRLHGELNDADAKFARVVKETVARGGKVIIPAFAVGRAQQLIFALHRLIDAQAIPRVPVYVDSPLAIDATEIFRMYLDAFDGDVKEMVERAHDPFGFRKLQYIREVEDSKRLNEMDEPMIVISASGMAEFGRIRHHLANNIADPRHTILIVGFQAEHTLGRKLAEGLKRVRIFGEEYTVRAQVERIDGFSAHADRDELLAWVELAKANLKGVFVVHGEEKSALALADGIRALGVPEVIVPKVGDTVPL